MHNRHLLTTSLATWLLLSLGACSRAGYERTHGELIGAPKKKGWAVKKPRGMSLVPGGTFTMGKSTYDPLRSVDAPSRTVSVSSFYMDETEITNRQYRQFVNWVRDSIVRTALAERAGTPEPSKPDGLAAYAYKQAKSRNKEPSAYEQYRAERTEGRDDTGGVRKQLDWSKALIWDRGAYPSKAYAEAIEKIYLSGEGAARPLIDTKQLNYVYYMPKPKASHEAGEAHSAHFIRKAINIYPDTTVWTRDFNFSYNEPLQRQYFWHEAYSEYPVVGVNWHQAKAFCAWRTNYKNGYQASRGKPPVSAFRLPTETEWEYAARGGIANEPYPWGGPYLSDERGYFLANFKPRRGDYLADGALYTAEARSYYPNQYNLYNMAGNVSEWTISSYEKASYYYYNSSNPSLEKGDKRNEKKVIRGGSWKDVGYYLKVSTRDFEYADSARSYIGFRTVEDYPGGRIPKRNAVHR